MVPAGLDLLSWPPDLVSPYVGYSDSAKTRSGDLYLFLEFSFTPSCVGSVGDTASDIGKSIGIIRPYLSI